MDFNGFDWISFHFSLVPPRDPACGQVATTRKTSRKFQNFSSPVMNCTFSAAARIRISRLNQPGDIDSWVGKV